MFTFACPHCRLTLNAQEELAGQEANCSGCRQPIVVPRSAPLRNADSGKPRDEATVAVDLKGPFPVNQRTPLTNRRPILRGKHGERYSVEGPLAVGGMGTVVRAYDRGLGREVAVKYVLDPSNAVQRARFFAEGRITGQLEHPNIVPIHDLGVDDQGRPFFAMKLVRGRSLKDILAELGNPASAKSAEGTYPLPRLIDILMSVCNALAYAHSREVIHRDLKPANIMVGDFGEVYVMDWGLAKVLHQTNLEVTPGRQLEPQSLTTEGTVLGTPLYMPPEQASGQINRIDPRSDIYSLGAILYEILTLRPPVETTDGVIATMIRVVAGEIVPPERRAPERHRAGQVPAELAAVAMKALQTQQHDRYATIEGLRHDLQRFLGGRGVSVKEDSVWETCIKLLRRNLVATGVAALSGVVVIALLTVSLGINWSTRAQADRALKAFQDLAEAKQQQARESVPAFVAAARLSVRQREHEQALAQVDTALKFGPEYPDALLLKAQLHLALRKDFSGAAKILDKYILLRPNDRLAAELHRLCTSPRPESNTLAVADILSTQKVPELAERVIASMEERHKLYRLRIEHAWPGLGEQLTVGPDGQLMLDLRSRQPITELTPLQGMLLSSLDISGQPITSLAPLEGMPLKVLRAANTRIKDLRPLEGMELKSLDLSGCRQVKDLTPLQGMPLESLFLQETAAVDFRALAGMPLRTLIFQPRRDSKGLDAVRVLKSLQWINTRFPANVSAETFWKKWDSGALDGK